MLRCGEIALEPAERHGGRDSGLGASKFKLLQAGKGLKDSLRLMGPSVTRAVCLSNPNKSWHLVGKCAV